MALGELGLPQSGKNRVGMAQKPQLVGNSALAFAQLPCRLLLAEVSQLHEPGNAHGLLDKVQILALEVFHHGGQTRLPVVHLHENAGHLRQTRHCRRPEPPLPGNQLVPRPHPTDGQGL